MNTSIIARKGLSIAALFLGLALPVGKSWAGAKLFDNSADTAATRFNGTVETTVNNNRDPFVAQVFTSGTECLRIAVVSQGTDLEATLVSPTGRIRQDDDGGGSLRPLIKAVTDVRGWYPLVLSNFVGSSVNADFTIDITRLPSTSALSSPATAPRPATRQQPEETIEVDLPSFGADTPLEELLASTTSPDVHVQTAALEALVSLYATDARAQRTVMASIRDPDPYVRSLIIGTLGPLLPHWPGAEDVLGNTADPVDKYNFACDGWMNLAVADIQIYHKCHEVSLQVVNGR